AGEGVTAYVIDTGVEYEHPDFEGRTAEGYDAIDGDTEPQDDHGHGTHVMGTVAGTDYGLAKKATVVGVRVLDANGSGTTEQVVDGINWVAENAPENSVANMSLGGPKDPALDEATTAVIGAGVTMAVAAGNESSDACQVSPGGVPEAITAGATDNADAQAEFSNFGECVDVYAPGVDIVSAAPGGGEATMSGTSMASPHVAGAAALYVGENPGAAPADVSAALTENALKDVVQNPGEGSPNLLLNTGFMLA
ncbi:MAG: S8 family peptidase, partial [Stackebrandtia sp.]